MSGDVGIEQSQPAAGETPKKATPPLEQYSEARKDHVIIGRGPINPHLDDVQRQQWQIFGNYFDGYNQREVPRYTTYSPDGKSPPYIEWDRLTGNISLPESRLAEIGLSALDSHKEVYSETDYSIFNALIGGVYDGAGDEISPEDRAIAEKYAGYGLFDLKRLEPQQIQRVEGEVGKAAGLGQDDARAEVREKVEPRWIVTGYGPYRQEIPAYLREALAKHPYCYEDKSKGIAIPRYLRCGDKLELWYDRLDGSFSTEGKELSKDILDKVDKQKNSSRAVTDQHAQFFERIIIGQFAKTSWDKLQYDVQKIAEKYRDVIPTGCIRFPEESASVVLPAEVSTVIPDIEGLTLAAAIDLLATTTQLNWQQRYKVIKSHPVGSLALALLAEKGLGVVLRGVEYIPAGKLASTAINAARAIQMARTVVTAGRALTTGQEENELLEQRRSEAQAQYIHTAFFIATGRNIDPEAIKNPAVQAAIRLFLQQSAPELAQRIKNAGTTAAKKARGVGENISQRLPGRGGGKP